MCDETTTRIGILAALAVFVIFLGYLLFDKDPNLGMYTTLAGLFFAFIIIATGLATMNRKKK